MRGLPARPTPIFNEKTLAGLGREVQSTGLAGRRRGRQGDSPRSSASARSATPCGSSGCGGSRPPPAATPDNGPAFIKEAERICRTKIDVLSGKREAELTALGVISGIHQPDGIVGDLGGGSLELVDVRGARSRAGVTLAARRAGAAGHLREVDQEGREDRQGRARRRAAARAGRGTHASMRSAAPGARWRGCTCAQTGYPLHVMHGYVIPASEALEFCRLVHRVNPETLSQIEVVADARRPLLPYAALVLEHIVRAAGRRRSSSPRSACARACSIRCSTPTNSARMR